MTDDLYNRIKNPKQPIFVIAEMAWSHDGSVDKALLIAKGASESGADAVNIHVTSLADYMTVSYNTQKGVLSDTHNEPSSVYNYLNRINLTPENCHELSNYIHALNLSLSVMCNDLKSLDYAVERLNPDLLMIHPSCVTDNSFVQSVARHQTPVVLYCGGLTLGEIEQAILQCGEVGNSKIILQHGFQNYPTLIHNNDIRYIKTLKDLFGFPVSFTDHTDAEDPMSLIVPLLSIPLGARIIEKHITFNRAEKGEDYESALNPHEFKTLVKYIRESESALGDSHWKPLSDSQMSYRRIVLKRAVAASNIQRGSFINESNVTFKRSDIGLYPSESQALFNKSKAQSDIEEGTPITWELIT